MQNYFWHHPIKPNNSISKSEYYPPFQNNASNLSAILFFFHNWLIPPLLKNSRSLSLKILLLISINKFLNSLKVIQMKLMSFVTHHRNYCNFFQIPFIKSITSTSKSKCQLYFQIKAIKLIAIIFSFSWWLIPPLLKKRRALSLKIILVLSSINF